MRRAHRSCRWNINSKILLFSALAFTGMVTSQALYAVSGIAASKTVVITMTDTPARYVPENRTIAKNTMVEWKNTTESLHDVSTKASDAQNKNDVHLPPGAKPFDSGFLMPGQIWKHRFSVPGHYTYFCLPHEKDGMVGHIDVTG